MLCDVCTKNPATVHLTEIIAGKIIEVHLCEECAKKKSEEFQKQFNITNFLSELVNVDPAGKTGLPALHCSNCGLTYQEFKKKGRLGCPQCYEDFKSQLQPLLRRMQGSSRHRGKTPKIKIKKEIPFDERMKELKAYLERAIKLEEYEEAARIRDEIRELERKNKKSKPNNR
ncbi:MAG: UvrB/UvrC motif-containing protein [Candidatus Omnitrophica bacterium]|nr:UvrB/UvrC motif-containing protein [Candidatus Omnitrophota bacterium]